MAEHIEPISRRMIAESTEEHAPWLGTYLDMCGGVFRTTAYDNEYRPGTMLAPEDFATGILYDNLMDSSVGRLEIPARLADDQVEDWFVAQALKKGLDAHKASREALDNLK
jgi:hypothetical protein